MYDAKYCLVSNRHSSVFYATKNSINKIRRHHIEIATKFGRHITWRLLNMLIRMNWVLQFSDFIDDDCWLTYPFAPSLCTLMSKHQWHWNSAFKRFLVPVCLSKVWLNWLIGGGILSRCCKTFLCLWTRMYLGHLTKRLKSRVGWISCPIPKFRTLFSNKGFCFFFDSCFFAASGGGAATFLPTIFFLPW